MLDITNVIAAFSEEQVERLTRLSKGRLRYWDKSGFFQPAHRRENSRVPFSRFYSFRDVVALRTLEMLRIQNGVPLQHLRKVAEKLAHLKDALWTQTTLFVLNKKVVFINPESGKPEEVVSGQYLLGIPLQRVIDDTRSDAERMQRRTDNEIGKLSRSRGIVQNSWVIAGTRVPVAGIKRLKEDGYSHDRIIAEYPDLTLSDVEAALASDKSKVA